MNRRAILGAALGTICFSAAAMPEELDLPREHVALVACGELPGQSLPVEP
jgi:hypothetical protein